MSTLCACFYVPVQQMWWLGDAVGQDDFAVDKANGPTRNLVGAKEFARRVVKDWVVLKGKGESASVGLGKSVCVHELKESRTRIGAKDVDFIAGTLVEPGLDPTPDSGEEGGGVDDGDLVNGFRIVGSGELRGLL